LHGSYPAIAQLLHGSVPALPKLWFCKAICVSDICFGFCLL
jgi:hypothetical protein